MPGAIILLPPKDSRSMYPVRSRSIESFGNYMASPTRVTGLDSLLPQLSEARERSDALFEAVRPEAFYERPIAERHRIIFYLGHLEAFDWNLFGRELAGLKSFAPSFDKLFAFGIDPVNGELPDDQPSDWPERKDVLRYNQGVRAALDDQLPAALEGPDERRRTLSQFLHVAVEHRLMHVETLTYMLHRLPLNLKCARQGDPAPRAPQVRPQMTEIPSGIATLGLRREDGVFGWDNEFPALSAEASGSASIGSEMATDCPGLIPHVTVGSIADASNVTRSS